LAPDFAEQGTGKLSDNASDFVGAGTISETDISVSRQAAVA
jgi:hypothetical protein